MGSGCGAGGKDRDRRRPALSPMRPSSSLRPEGRTHDPALVGSQRPPRRRARTWRATCARGTFRNNVNQRGWPRTRRECISGSVAARRDTTAAVGGPGTRCRNSRAVHGASDRAVPWRYVGEARIAGPRLAQGDLPTAMPNGAPTSRGRVRFFASARRRGRGDPCVGGERYVPTPPPPPPDLTRCLPPRTRAAAVRRRRGTAAPDGAHAPADVGVAADDGARLATTCMAHSCRQPWQHAARPATTGMRSRSPRWAYGDPNLYAVRREAVGNSRCQEPGGTGQPNHPRRPRGQAERFKSAAWVGPPS